MYNHAPEGYICPFCLVAQGIENEHVWTRQDDVIYRDGDITAFVSAGCWPDNKGHVLVIPNRHYENVYGLPDDLSAKIHAFGREAALALKGAYRCGGVSFRQHNEPCGGQDVWHYHLHVFPRYPGDNLNGSHMELLPPEERKLYANQLKGYFESNI